jgi:hypothetical protein
LGNSPIAASAWVGYIQTQDYNSLKFEVVAGKTVSQVTGFSEVPAL